MEETTKLIDDMISETPSQPNGATIADAKGCCFPVDRPAVADRPKGCVGGNTKLYPSPTLLRGLTDQQNRSNTLRNDHMVAEPLVTQFHIHSVDVPCSLFRQNCTHSSRATKGG